MIQIPIKRTIERIPGGMMIVPLLLGSLVATFAPDTPKFFGSFTNALFTGALPILAVFYVCMGASINVRTTPYLLKKGGALLTYDSFFFNRSLTTPGLALPCVFFITAPTKKPNSLSLPPL